MLGLTAPGDLKGDGQSRSLKRRWMANRLNVAEKLRGGKNEKEPECGSFVSVVYNIHSPLLPGGIKNNPEKEFFSLACM